MQLQWGFIHDMSIKPCRKAHCRQNHPIAKISTLKNQHGSPAPLASRRRPRGRNANLAGLNRAPMLYKTLSSAAPTTTHTLYLVPLILNQQLYLLIQWPRLSLFVRHWWVPVYYPVCPLFVPYPLSSLVPVLNATIFDLMRRL